MDPLNIGVVGGSLGGLTAACLLRDLGHEVTVFERSARELEQRGAGIGYLTATGRYLQERAGVATEAITVATPSVRYLDRTGAVVHHADHPYLFSSWNTVYRATLDSFPTDRYLLGHELVGFDVDPSQARARFSNGATFHGDLLVCADGIGSLARQRLQPEAMRAYAGYVAWRGVVPEAALAPRLAEELSRAITYFVYPNSHILVYPIPNIAGSVAPGERLINFVWYRNYDEGEPLDDLLTDRNGVRRDLSVPPGLMAPHHEAEARASAAADLPPQIAEVVGATTDLFVQVVYDVDVTQLVFGRTILLGDAAFAVRPHAAAGTAKAADDGWALADALTSASPGNGTGDSSWVTAALAAWEPDRLALGQDLLARTRRIGRRSQVDNSWTPGDPEFIFGLHRPGD